MHAATAAGCAAVGLGAVLTAFAGPPLPLILLLSLLCLGALHHEHHLTTPGPHRRRRSISPAERTDGALVGSSGTAPPVVLSAVLLLPVAHLIATITLLHLYQRARPHPGHRLPGGTRSGWWWPLAEIATTTLAALAGHTALAHSALPQIALRPPGVQAGDPGQWFAVLAATGAYLATGVLIRNCIAATSTAPSVGGGGTAGWPWAWRSYRWTDQWADRRADPAVLVAEHALAALLAMILATAPPLVVLLVPLLWLSHRAARDAHLARSATRDDKTGLLTTTTWRTIATTTLAQRGATTGVIIVDLDHFKQINDQHGHLAGDHVLGLVADTLTGCVRGGDSVARFGGDEFLILLPDTTAADTTTIAERIRHSVTRLQLPTSGPIPGTAATSSGRITVSIGVAHHPPDTDPDQDVAAAPDPTRDLDPDTALGLLLRTADRALYQSKNSGRNTITGGSAALSTPTRTGP